MIRPDVTSVILEYISHLKLSMSGGTVLSRACLGIRVRPVQRRRLLPHGQMVMLILQSSTRIRRNLVLNPPALSHGLR